MYARAPDTIEAAIERIVQAAGGWDAAAAAVGVHVATLRRAANPMDSRELTAGAIVALDALWLRMTGQAPLIQAVLETRIRAASGRPPTPHRPAPPLCRIGELTREHAEAVTAYAAAAADGRIDPIEAQAVMREVGDLIEAATRLQRDVAAGGGRETGVGNRKPGNGGRETGVVPIRRPS